LIFQPKKLTTQPLTPKKIQVTPQFLINDFATFMIFLNTFLQIYRLNAMPDKKPGLEPVSKCLLQVESSKLDPKNKI
jgi:hypothetical protein